MASLPSLWKFGGLTPLQLVRLAVKKIGQDALSTRSAALSYYFLGALFPMLVFLLSLLGLFAAGGTQFRDTIMSGLARVMPGSASQMIERVLTQVIKSSSGVKLAAGIFGALWSASGGVSAVVTSLNKIYRTNETRPWWKQKLTVVGLTLALAALIILGLVLALYGGKIGALIANKVGLGSVFAIAWKILVWPVAFAAMFLSYSLMYYFGPDLMERRWNWVTPGAVVGVALWLAASLGFRFYLQFFNSYNATYGSVGAVIILMLWLYITGFAILIGGEVNWVIEDQDKKAMEFEAQRRAVRQPPTEAQAAA